ncbi:putative non-specific serine/threonine protein kinase [Helianthus annuus]|nr:putative non-specific serine/threonine protein kinase [Helianthus annuus]KAJ0471646.1 putative non-specific serine/threonine protein kinase [Helianthus annuus]KAJ0647286.1 putative non-specific serine/threonine protein kinase [Helianthus annuus]
MDMFSLGCVLFFCMTSGKHPFGDTPPERGTNVIDNKMNLSLLEHIPEAGDLCSQLLNRDPELRYNITIVKF